MREGGIKRERERKCVCEKEREIKKERSSELLCVRERKSVVCLIEEEYVCKRTRVSICV